MFLWHKNVLEYIDTTPRPNPKCQDDWRHLILCDISTGNYSRVQSLHWSKVQDYLSSVDVHSCLITFDDGNGNANGSM